jgi:hypothetical protein
MSNWTGRQEVLDSFNKWSNAELAEMLAELPCLQCPLFHRCDEEAKYEGLSCVQALEKFLNEPYEEM